MKLKNIFILIPLCFSFFSILAAENSSKDSLEKFILQQKQQAEQQRQKNLEELQKIKEAQQLPPATSTKASPAAQSTPVTTALQQPKTTEASPEINCNDPYSQYNYPSNYVYNYQNQRVYQLHPFAKCAPVSPPEPVAMPTGTTTITTPSPAKPSATSTTSTSQTDSDQSWGIQY